MPYAKKRVHMREKTSVKAVATEDLKQILVFQCFDLKATLPIMNNAIMKLIHLEFFQI